MLTVDEEESRDGEIVLVWKYQLRTHSKRRDKLTLSLETLILSLVEESLHDSLFKLDRIVDLEGCVSNPRDDIFETTERAFVQYHVKLPWKCCFSAASSLGQHLSRISLARNSNRVLIVSNRKLWEKSASQRGPFFGRKTPMFLPHRITEITY